MEKYMECLEKTPLFAGIGPAELEALLPCLRARQASYQKGDFLLRAGETIGSLGILLEGRVLVVQEDFWGSRNLLDALAPGDCFGETFACSPGTPLTVSVVAETAVKALYFNVQQVLTLCPESCGHHTRMVRNLLGELARKNVAFAEKLTHLGQRTTRAKLISYLSAQSRRAGSEEFDIPFTRQQLADYLCVDRSGLSQELGRLRDEGLLTFRKQHFHLCRQELC